MMSNTITVLLIVITTENVIFFVLLLKVSPCRRMCIICIGVFGVASRFYAFTQLFVPFSDKFTTFYDLTPSCRVAITSCYIHGHIYIRFGKEIRTRLQCCQRFVTFLKTAFATIFP